MQIPYLNEPQISRDVVDAFGGYDHRDRIADNCFYDAQNLTSDHYPAMGPRAPRGVRTMPQGAEKPDAILSGSHFAYAADGWLYVDDAAVMPLTEEKPKRLISMGAYIVVLPDKVYYNTADKTDNGAMEASFVSDGDVTFTLCKGNGEAYASAPTVSDAAPTDPENMDLWLDTSQTPNILKQYSDTSGIWAQIATTYVKISATGIGEGFRAFDGVTISGIPESAGQIAEYNGKSVILNAVGNDYIVTVGLIGAETTGDQPLTVSRRMPVMDHVFESGNRLWGCRYGENAEGKFVNEIYCSKLGDFKNWSCYQGASTDSYTASVGTDGAFTGGIAYLGYPLFFKENCLHKVYGAYPAAFQIEVTACRGVQQGAERSLAILNERLYYKSRSGVCVYDGSYPAEISEAFGAIRYTGAPEDGKPAAAAGAVDNKYYISMLSEADGMYHLFVYDAARAVWHREDNTFASGFAVSNGILYMIDETRGCVAQVNANSRDGDPVGWQAETGAMGMESPDAKTLTRITLRMRMAIGSRLMIYAQYDSKDPWIHLSTLTGTSLRSFSVAIRPQRCDHFRLRFVGRGDAQIFSLTKSYEQGSETP